VSDQLWTAAQVARRLNVSTDFVYRGSRDGTIPTISLGRYKRYRPAAVEAWLEELEKGAAHRGPVAGSTNTVMLRRGRST
jgi:excisionase family DNA binding protein